MEQRKRSHTFGLILLLVSVLLYSCQHSALPSNGPSAVLSAAAEKQPAVQASTAAPGDLPAQAAVSTPAARSTPPAQDAQHVTKPRYSGQPAGCLSAVEQSRLASPDELLAYAEKILGTPNSLTKRLLGGAWNAYDQVYYSTDTGAADAALRLNVDDVKPRYVIQRIMNALQLAGFVTWLRSADDQSLQILAVPMIDKPWADSPWAPYISAYWDGPLSTPSADPSVIPVMKLPPCSWMVEGKYAPEADYSSWYSKAAGWPDYASPASTYLADTMDRAAEVAQRINWLGEGTEGPLSMCGPLVWAIMNDAGVFPPGFGDWSTGPSVFWLSKPNTNGRPWSLFPEDTYTVYHFSTPLGAFDFNKFPLYPGDFLYTYSWGDGFDHMLMVTEKDADGNLYTVSNMVKEVPEKKITIERVVLYNEKDTTLGIARNEWYKDRVNGRTGHAGFDVFRWAWMEKDIRGEAQRYTVQPGDTLNLIAARWRTPLDEIARYNDLNSNADLTVGQVIVIPPNDLPER